MRMLQMYGSKLFSHGTQGPLDTEGRGARRNVITSPCQGVEVFSIIGFDSGEGALKTATTSKEGSRHANYPMNEVRGSDEK